MFYFSYSLLSMFLYIRSYQISSQGSGSTNGTCIKITYMILPYSFIRLVIHLPSLCALLIFLFPSGTLLLSHSNVLFSSITPSSCLPALLPSLPSFPPPLPLSHTASLLPSSSLPSSNLPSLSVAHPSLPFSLPLDTPRQGR